MDIDSAVLREPATMYGYNHAGAPQSLINLPQEINAQDGQLQASSCSQPSNPVTRNVADQQTSDLMSPCITDFVATI